MTGHRKVGGHQKIHRDSRRTPDQYARSAVFGPCEAEGRVVFLTRKAAKARFKQLYPNQTGTAERCSGNPEHWHMVGRDAAEKTEGRS